MIINFLGSILLLLMPLAWVWFFAVTIYYRRFLLAVPVSVVTGYFYFQATWRLYQNMDIADYRVPSANQMSELGTNTFYINIYGFLGYWVMGFWHYFCYKNKPK
jgi:hypothetical protein